MREIKFRAWDKENKEWLRYVKKQLGWRGSQGVVEVKPLMTWVYESSDGEAYNDLQFLIDSEHFEVCQYTGLKDKNGKEIWEGDVVSGKACNDEPLEICFIDACFELYDRGGNYYGDLKQIYSMLEVIGNIYENPELLKNAE